MELWFCDGNMENSLKTINTDMSSTSASIEGDIKGGWMYKGNQCLYKQEYVVDVISLEHGQMQKTNITLKSKSTKL